MTTELPQHAGGDTLFDIRVDGAPYKVKVSWTVRTARFRRKSLVQIVTIFAQRELRRHPETGPFAVLPDELTADLAEAIDAERVGDAN